MFAALLLAPLLIFHGNVALLEDVYRSFLDLPASTKATPANARSVATRITSFLHRAGYALATRLGLAEFAYEIVPVPNLSAPKVQIDEFDPIEKISMGLVRPGRPYELHILVQPGQFRPGLSPELEINSVQGGAVGATYHSGRLISREDRWSLGARVGA